MQKGKFITFEGNDGCGKSTHIRLLEEYLKSKGYEILVTREPGATEAGKIIRDLLLNKNYKDIMTPEAELFLYEADRAIHTNSVILPALNEGKVVLSDRYYDSTTAYQGIAGKVDLGFVLMCNEIASHNLKPDLTFYIDAGLDETESKVTTGEYGAKDRMETKSETEKLRRINGFRIISLLEPERVKVIKYIPNNITGMQQFIRQYTDLTLKD